MMSEAGVADDVANHRIYQRHIQKEIRHEGIRQSGIANLLLIIITKNSPLSGVATVFGICDVSTEAHRGPQWADI